MKKVKKKILFVAFLDSIHAVRWINQISGDDNFTIYLFPSRALKFENKSFKNVNIYLPFYWVKKIFGGRIHHKIAGFLYKDTKRNDHADYQKRFQNFIKGIQPDLIHSLETQHAGYLVLETKHTYFKNSAFPLWWHTNYGSDFFLFAKFADHKLKIETLLSECNYYSCESERDKILARQLGYKNEILSTYPNAGGFDLKLLEDLKARSPLTSKRKLIMLKGYQGWVGRALVAMKALALVHELLSDYSVVLYSNSHGEDVHTYRKVLEADFGIRFIVVPHYTSHVEMMEYFSNARLYIGLSISDGISTSLLESMACGCFPVQSNTSTADEWVINGESAFLVEPEEPLMVAEAIKKALTNDALVDIAAELNWTIVKERLNENNLKEQTLHSYKKILINEIQPT